MALIEFSNKGLYCPQAEIYIDPWRKVKKALVTHGHADHARWGMDNYLCTEQAAPVIQYRLNCDPSQISTVAYGEKIKINGVQFSFHPAGHVPGSAQIRVEYKGEVWVVSGDYKTEADGLSEPFEAVKCHTFITESTFGLPVYKWEPQHKVIHQIEQWWADNQSKGVNSVLFAYSLGKAQRILANINTEIGPIITHYAVTNINKILKEQSYPIPNTHPIDGSYKKGDLKNALIIAPPAVAGSAWLRKFGPYELAMVSGWMNIRGARRRRATDTGFVISDHADWQGLNDAVAATEAERVFVTHGYTDIFSRWLNSKGIESEVVVTNYSGEDASDTAADDEGGAA